MLDFFAILLIIFIGILLLVFKKRSIRKLINNGNLYSDKLKNNRKNKNKFLSNKNSFLYNHEEKSTQYFIKILKDIRCLFFFRVIQKIN